MVRRWRRRRQLTQRARLADDARRTVWLMAAMLADAERAHAEVPDGVAACLTVWRSGGPGRAGSPSGRRAASPSNA